MGATAASPPIVDLTVGGTWEMVVMITDVDGALVDDVPVCVVTKPDGTESAPVPSMVAAGLFKIVYTVTMAGRHVSRVIHAQGSVSFAAYANAVVPAGDMPDVESAKAYLGIDASDTSRDAEVQDALDAEAAAQRSVCRVPATYPDDLREALHRRVARNLALRLLPLAVLRGDGEAGDTVLPGNDPEVKRLERPHRRLPIG